MGLEYKGIITLGDQKITANWRKFGLELKKWSKMTATAALIDREMEDCSDEAVERRKPMSCAWALRELVTKRRLTDV